MSEVTKKRRYKQPPNGIVPYDTKEDDRPKERYDRFSWLEGHPEDIQIDKENQRMRKRGYENDDIKNLMAAICLRACIDYKAATLGKKVDDHIPEYTIEDCRAFFGDTMFQHFVNGLPVKEIEAMIRRTPPGEIHNLWKKART